MINIRPVSDLRYKFKEIEEDIKEGEPVYLTKNGYGTMVVLSLDAYAKLVDTTEIALDEADRYAKEHPERLSHDEVFDRIRNHLHD